MSFVLSKLLWLLVAPGNLLTLVLASGVGLQAVGGRRARRIGLGLTAGVAVIAVGLMLIPVDAWLIGALEQRFPIPTLPERVDGIIVLGGMVDPSSAARWGRPRLNQEADRLTEFVYLARRYPEARLVFTGGSGALVETDLIEVPVAREILRRVGLAIERVQFEGASRNTWENAIFSREAVQPKPGEIWVLITSAFHMPRSVGIFRQAGWPVLPYPVGFRTGRHSGEGPSFAFAGTLARVEDALHEWAGLFAYHWLGRTDAWFPGP